MVKIPVKLCCFLAILGLSLSVGCESKNGLSSSKKNTNDNEELVRKWLAKFPSGAEFDTRGFLVKLDRPIDDFESDWLKEGKAIVGLDVALLRILGDKDPPMRAAYAAAKYKINGSVSLILAKLDDKGMTAWNRRELVLALGILGDGIAIERLGAILVSDPDVNVRAAATVSLGQLGVGSPELVLPHLLPALGDASEFVVNVAKRRIAMLEEDQKGEERAKQSKRGTGKHQSMSR